MRSSNAKEGDAENRIKEQQPGLFADRTSCHEFVPNQFRVILGAAASVCQIWIKAAEAGDRFSTCAESASSSRRSKAGSFCRRAVNRRDHTDKFILAITQPAKQDWAFNHFCERPGLLAAGV